VQVHGRADDYANQLKLALTNRTGDDAQGNDLEAPAKRASKSIVDEFEAFINETKLNMGLLSTVTIEPSSAGRIADTIIDAAGNLDAHYSQSLEALDDLFERTYVAIREGERDLKTTVLAGDNPIGRINERAMDLDDRAYEIASPTLDRTWDSVSKPLQQAPLPPVPAAAAQPAPAASGTGTAPATDAGDADAGSAPAGATPAGAAPAATTPSASDPAVGARTE
jgi:hypothetical protein